MIKGTNHSSATNTTVSNGSREGLDLLTVEQAAAYLQLSQSSIRSYIRQGKLEAFRIAGLRKVLIRREAVIGLLEPARTTDA